MNIASHYKTCDSLTRSREKFGALQTMGKNVIEPHNFKERTDFSATHEKRKKIILMASNRFPNANREIKFYSSRSRN